MHKTGDSIYILIRLGLGCIFIYSGATKLIAPLSFATIIDAYGFLPEIFNIPISVSLSILELIAGIGILFDIKGSLAILTSMLILFIIILSYGIWMGLDVDCGCFGAEDPEAEAFHGLRTALYRDLVMMAGIFFLYVWRRIGSLEPIHLSNPLPQLSVNKMKN